MEKILIKRYIEQVQDGCAYKGHITIGRAKLDYGLRFAVPIPQLDDMEPVKGAAEIRRIFQLTIKREGAEIELTEDEHGFFFQMLVPFAAEFYNDSQTRGLNQGAVGMVINNSHPMMPLGMRASIGLTSNVSVGLPTELCEILNGPKFGCQLVA